MGMTMQNLVLAVQNTVAGTDLGAATSTVSFFRSLGGTVGVSVLGAVLSHRVSSLLGVPASGASSGTSDLGQLDGAAAVAVRAAYGDAIGRVFLIAAIGSILTLVAVAFIKEVPLRTTVGRTPEAAPVDTASTEIAARTDDGHHPRHAAPADSDARPGCTTPHSRGRRRRSSPSTRSSAPRNDLADARGRLASSVDRLRAAGFGQQQIDGLLARRVSDGVASRG